MNKLVTLFAAACAVSLGVAAPASAADFPQRPITLVVPWGAGGGSDIIARTLVSPLEKELGKPVIVTNKAGGSGTIGTSFVAHSRPDGYTVGLINNTGLIHQIHYGGLEYTREDLDPLCLFLKVPVFLVVNSASPIKTLDDYVKTAKEKDGALTLGVAAVGGGTHLPIELFFEKAGIKVQPMPFKDGGSGVLTALVGNHIDSGVIHPSEAYGQYKAGNLRVLGVLDETRLEAYPEIPTFKESGYDATGQVWRSFVVPKGTPKEVKDILVKAIETATKDPTYLETLAKIGDLPTWMGPEEFAKYLEEDDTKLLATIKRLNLYNKNVQ
ncbi:MAG: tripartite tricarboxylate transporter substrate binding protein [Methylobacteriaceae bacterium]|jgi:tripartite-type tricarboxylate transporter receptor subunit TctC|nr:tripartite tricarboxylate transporter substrate binding protein [Methylobacteriaceae bacterium]